MQSRIIPEFLINYNLKCLRIKIKKVNTFRNTFTFLNFSSVQIYLIRFLSRYDGIKLNHIAEIDRKFRACGVFCVSDKIPPYRVGNIRPFRNRVTVTRRALVFFIFKIGRAVVSGNISGSPLRIRHKIKLKKDREEPISPDLTRFVIALHTASEL